MSQLPQVEAFDHLHDFVAERDRTFEHCQRIHASLSRCDAGSGCLVHEVARTGARERAEQVLRTLADRATRPAAACQRRAAQACATLTRVATVGSTRSLDHAVLHPGSLMQLPQPFVREAGSGASVVCIHANASSSAQWRGLMDDLAPTRRVLAPDCYGSGKSPQWPLAREMFLDDEVRFLGEV